jgi:hypothetical protein
VATRVERGPGVFVGDPEDVARGRAREARRGFGDANVEASGGVAPPPPPRRGWYAPGGTLEGVYEKAKGETALSLNPGSIFRAKLVVGVSSLAPNGVVAQVVEDVRQDGRVRPARRRRASGPGPGASGTGSTSPSRGSRPGNAACASRATRWSAACRALVAQVRASSLEERSESGAGRGALGAAGNVLGEIVGQTLPGRVVRGVAEGALPEAQRDLAPDHSAEILELPAGRVFEVVVTEGQT